MVLKIRRGPGRLPLGTGSTPSGAPRSSAGLGLRLGTGPPLMPRGGVGRYCALAHPLSNLAQKPRVYFRTMREYHFWGISSVYLIAHKLLQYH